MASSKSSKTEKKTSKDGESAEAANKPSKARKDEELERKKKNKKNAKDKEKDQKKKNGKKDNDNNKEKEQKKNKLSNGHVKENKMLIVPSSSTEEEDNTYEVDNTEITNGRTTDTKPKGKRKKGDDDDRVAEDSKTQRFPMHRIKTIIRAEDIDSRVSQEAIFVVNKATEKFLEHLTQNAYGCCVQDRKKSLSYKHLSSVVSKQRRYDFLSDFVPEKVKAEDALREKNSGGTPELKNCKTC